jgi:hypothetical protein
MTRVPWVLSMILGLFLESCNTDFDINAPQRDVYVLNCILRNDTSIQYATISKNYFTENGVAPPSNTIEPNIKGATIKIFHNDLVFVMRDTTVELTESETSVRVDCYYVRNLELEPGKTVSIEAALPGGEILKSSIQVHFTLVAPSTFPQDNLAQENRRGSYVKFPFYLWRFRIGLTETSNILSYPRMEIDYEKYEGGMYINKKTLVPLAYYLSSDDNLIVKSSALTFSYNYYAYTSLEIVNKTMQDISGSDPFKNNYVITRVFLNITSLDPELSKYYSAYQVWSNAASIRLRPTDYSNIEGGKGIFGICYKSSHSQDVDKAYVNSFGYQYDPSMY